MSLPLRVVLVWMKKIMAKKIRSWEEYDVSVKERQERFEGEVESELEHLVLEDLKEKKRRVGMVQYAYRHPGEMVRALLGGPEEMARIYVEQNKEEFRPRAERELFLENFGSNIHDLVRGGVFLSHQQNEKLPDADQQSLYVRFLDALKELMDKDYLTFEQEYPEAEEIGRGFHPPEREEDFNKVKKVVYGLQRRKYISIQNAETLIRLLAPFTQRITTPVRQVQSSSLRPGQERTPAAAERLALEKNRSREIDDFLPASPPTYQERLDYLMLLIELPEETVQRYAGELTFEQLEEVHIRLLEVVGEKYATRLLQSNPAILGYVGEKLFSKYIKTLREVQEKVQERIRRNGGTEDLEEKFDLERNLERYAHLEQLLELKRELFAVTGSYALPEGTPASSEETNLGKIVQKYSLLQKGQGMVEKRLSSLVEKGSVTVEKNEHWSDRGKTIGGARGRNILQKIASQLAGIFNDSELGRPIYEINYGQHSITIDENTRTLLKDIRDKAYQWQDKGPKP